MAVVNVSFNGFDLQNDTYLTRNIQHRHLAEKVLNSRPSLREGKRRILDTWYTEKIVELSGWIISDSEANLRTAIDNLKEALRPKEKNLDIDYGSGTIRYVATCQSLEIPEEHWHTTQVPFTIRFSAEPWGIDPTTDSNSWTGITATSYSNSINIQGSHSPYPVIEITSNKTISMGVKFQNDTTGDWIQTSETQSFSTNSVLEIDTKNQTFKLDGTEIDFDGVFPNFEPGTNNFTVTISGTSPDYDLKIKYNPTYL